MTLNLNTTGLVQVRNGEWHCVHSIDNGKTGNKRDSRYHIGGSSTQQTTEVDVKRDGADDVHPERQGRKLIPAHILLIPGMLKANSARGNNDTPLWMYGHLGKASHQAHAVWVLILVRSLASCLRFTRYGKLSKIVVGMGSISSGEVHCVSTIEEGGHDLIIIDIRRDERCLVMTSELGLTEFAKERSTGSTMHAERNIVLATALRRLFPTKSCIARMTIQSIARPVHCEQ